MVTKENGEGGTNKETEITIGNPLNRKENRKTTKDHQFKDNSRSSRMITSGIEANGKLVKEENRGHQFRTVKTTLADGTMTAIKTKKLKPEVAPINLERLARGRKTHKQ